jgi:hypothetical protein
VESPAILLIFLDFFAYVFVVIDLHTFPFFQLGSPPVDRMSVTHHFQLYIWFVFRFRKPKNWLKRTDGRRKLVCRRSSSGMSNLHELVLLLFLAEGIEAPSATPIPAPSAMPKAILPINTPSAAPAPAPIASPIAIP